MAGVLRSHGVDSGARLPPGVVSSDVAPEDSPRLQCLKLLLAATDREAEDDWVGAMTILRTALANGMSSEDRDVWANLGNMALHLGDEVTHRTLFTAMLAGARADGAVMEVLYALHRLCLSQYAVGDWSGVRRSADEAVALARSLGQPAQTVAPLAWLTLLAALQGRDDYASLLESASELLNGRRIGVMDAFVADLLHWAQATAAAQSGDSAQSFHHVNQMHPGVVTRLAAAPRIMAAAQASRHDRAEEWTSELVRLAASTKLPWVEAVACYGRALINDGEDASAAFEAALEHHGAARRPYDAALAQLAYGEHLRRAGRRVDARTHLKTALETFRDLEAEPLAERAANELRASGESARKRDPSTSVDLTPTELRIAELVSQGLSQQGGRGAVLGLTAHGGVPPPQRVRQDRRDLAR